MGRGWAEDLHGLTSPRPRHAEGTPDIIKYIPIPIPIHSEKNHLIIPLFLAFPRAAPAQHSRRTNTLPWAAAAAAAARCVGKSGGAGDVEAGGSRIFVFFPPLFIFVEAAPSFETAHTFSFIHHGLQGIFACPSWTKNTKPCIQHKHSGLRLVEASEGEGYQITHTMDDGFRYDCMAHLSR